MKYIVSFLVSLLLLPEFMRFAYMDRGYSAYGGEILIPILVPVLIFLFTDFTEFIGAYDKEEEEVEECNKEIVELDVSQRQ